jgi:hypothetical protein
MRIGGRLSPGSERIGAVTVYAETPLGNALARMGSGERCAVATVLECTNPACGRVYPDDELEDAGNCGPCEWSHRHTGHPTRFRVVRRARRPADELEVAFRY